MTAFLFPGQGSQQPGMGKDFLDASPPCAELFDQARAVLPQSFLDTLFNSTAAEVKDTRIAQPALVLVGAASSTHLRSLGIAPTATAGHSIGEIGALFAAGSLDLTTALCVTVERARLMAEESPPGTMAAVLGMDPQAIPDLLPEGLDVANYNGPGQTIISGPHDAVEQARTTLKEAGAKRVMPLPVSGPFHSWCMKDAAEKFRNYLRDVVISAPACRFVSSVSGSEETDPERIRGLLADQLFSPVQWTKTMETLGPVDALELGPGTVLQGIAKRTPDAPKLRGAGTLEAIAALELN